MNQRNQGIDVTRCIANYMIILLHASAVDQYCNQQTTEATFWNFIYDYVCPAALPVLFLISGYLLFKNFTLSDYFTKLRRRVGRLVVPYLAWNIFFVAFFLLGSMAVPRLADRVATFDLHSLSGVTSKIVSLMVHPIDGPLWFIRTLFIYSLLSPIMAFFLKKKYLNYIFLAIIIGVGLWLASADLTRYLTLTYPIYSLVMFFIGGMLSNTNATPISLFEGKKMLVFSLLGLVAATLVNSMTTNAVALEACNIAMFFFKAAVLIGILSILNFNKLSANPTFNKFRELSFFAYAGHFLFCSILLHLVAPRLGFMEIGKQTLLTLWFCFGGVALMWVIYFAGRKLCPGVMRIFDGNLKF